MVGNPILNTDSYKLSHWKQYPPGTRRVYSYLEPRESSKYKEVVFFGLQYVLDRHFAVPVTHTDIADAKPLLDAHIGPGVWNESGWRHIVDKHGGFLPVRIMALPEGTVVPAGTPMLTIENTCDECFWVTNYVETVLVQLWYPCTVATVSREVKKTIKRFLDETGDPAGLTFKLHDFGFRGASSAESAAIGGAAHLVNFNGTDTLAAVQLVKDHYGEDCAGFSIPAAEHSTITAWGRWGEKNAFANMLEQYPTGLVAVVSDSYNLMTAVNQIWGVALRDKVLKRKGTLVIRPDSGEPVRTVMDTLTMLGDRFGWYKNEKGYAVLDPRVRIIQGDGVNPASILDILDAMKDHGWSADNIAFGMGGFLLQRVHRDMCSFAMKASWMDVGGEARDVWKDPFQDGSKASKRGRLAVYAGADGELLTVQGSDYGTEMREVTAYGMDSRAGRVSFSEIRERAAI